MIKDKAVRKAEFKAALIKKLKGLIAPVIGILVIVGIVLLVKYLQKPAEAEPPIEVHSYTGEEKQISLENDQLKFTMDPSTTHFSVEVKDTGAVWNSNPTDIDSDPLAVGLEKQKLQSTLLLYYSTQNGVDTLFNNYKYSIENQTYDIEYDEDSIKVYYSIGDAKKEFLIPIVIEKERFDSYCDQMEPDARSRVERAYKKYDINKLSNADKDKKDELLEQYPILADQVCYVLYPTTKDAMRSKLAGDFEAVGYTREEYEQDQGAGSDEATSDKPVFNITVVYRLEGDQLIVDVPMEEIEYREKYPIYSLCVLPYFGAGNTTDEGYMMVPEGGGAMINFNNGKTAQNSYYSDLYGWDRAQDRDAVVHETHSYMNAFGIAKNDNSFLCILEDGDPYAGICADISGKQNSYNFVYAQYSIIHREKYEVGTRYEGTMYVYEAGIAPEHLTERFCFIGSADYSDMAVVYQNYLINKYPDSFVKNEDTSVPAVVEIVGAVDKIEQVCGIPTSMPLELTTYKEAKQIISDLTDDGMNNLSVKLTGWANHGVQQRMLDSVKLVSRLGSKKDFQSLTKYAANNGVDLYLNGITDYAYDSDIFDGFFVFTDAARFVNNKKAEIYPYSTIYYSAREKQDPYYLLKPELIDEMVDNLVDYAKTSNANVSFEEIGSHLNSDYHKGEITTRQTILNKEVQELQKLYASDTKVMINMGNSYAAAYSDMITNMPLTGFRYSIIDASIPVYQMALHGYKNYTGKSLNLTQNFDEDFLYSVEYGAGLSFTVMDESAFTLQGSLYTEYFGAEYDAVHQTIKEKYNEYNEALGHTFGLTMVDHKILTNTLRMTQYSDGTKVYVNYAYEETTTPDGVTVPARDYVVVK